MQRLFLSLLLSLGIASSASAVAIDWTPIGNPGNQCFDVSQPIGCTGAVADAYRIGTYEVTNAQYTGFLNSVAATDTFFLYNTLMDTEPEGGITRSGTPGSYSYSAKPGFENNPVNYVSYHSALRFTNWLHNDQRIGLQDSTTTEGGAYTFASRTEVGPRNPGAQAFLPSENEWFKAAYYDAPEGGYHLMPGGSNSMGCSAPTLTPNFANCIHNFTEERGLVPVGSYPNSPSPYGTFDQGGNVAEWIERLVGVPFPSNETFTRGGAYVEDAAQMYWERRRYHGDGNVVGSFFGFRVASTVPEPSTGLLVACGLLGLTTWRRRA